MRTAEEIVRERLYSRVKRSGDCLEWQGATNGRYGNLWYRGRVWLTHRLAWHLEHAGDLDGRCVLHACDNTLCVNVEHLRVGTQAENIRDMVKKGRAARGERQPGAKLTERAVREIRARRASGEGARELGEEYGVSRSLIGLVARGKRWGYVT